MRTIIIISFIFFWLLGNAQSVRVKGYRKKSGTYVVSHRKTKSDHTQRNNWSSTGNINPYTGKKCTKRAKK